MIEAECPVCWSQGPHWVTEDSLYSVEAICEDCGCKMHVVL